MRSRARAAQSPDCLLNLEIGTQSRDSENAQRNLEIAQILRLRGTYTPSVFTSVSFATEDEDHQAAAEMLGQLIISVEPTSHDQDGDITIT